MNCPSYDREDFDRCWPWIEAGMACDYGGPTHTKEECWDLIEQGLAFFWPGQRCANISDVFERPTYKVLNLWSSGGDLKELVNVLLPRIEVWATDNGYQYTAFSSDRLAWVRVLEGHGYALAQYTYAKGLQ